MLLGVILAKKKYKLSKYVSVFFISVGIFICTWMSAKSKEAEQGDQGQDSNSESDAITFGILLLVYALIVSSLMGLMQEVTYKKYGKHPNEALFIDHVLGLPCFYLFTDSITSSFGKLLATETVAEFSSSNAYFQSRVETMTAYLPLFKPLYENFLNPLPIGVLFLLINILTSYCCIKSVFVLTTECTSLTVTLVITVRKFLTLMVSVFYFGNDFSMYHWMGTFLVFFGALVYADVIKMGKKEEKLHIQ